MNLLEFLKRYPKFVKIYEILKPFLMANPENIRIFPIDELKNFGHSVRGNVIAAALQPDKLFFRFFPPSEYEFAHELIHLCVKPKDVPEEVYGYNLASVVLFAAEENIENVNPFKLFELREDEINTILRKKFKIDNIDEFYKVLGIIPYTHELKATTKGLKIVRSPHYTKRDRVVAFVAEISGGVQHFPLCRKILAELLKLCKVG